MMKKVLVSLFVAFAFGSTLFAQGAAKKGDDKNPTLTIKLRIYRWSVSNSIVLPDHTGNQRRSSTRNPITDLWYKDKDAQWKSIPMASGGITKEFEYNGPPNLEFYMRNPKAKRDDKDAFRSVGRVMLPFNTESLFLLMIQRGERARFFPMNVSPKVLPKDRVAVLNMTAQNIGVNMGDNNTILRAGGYGIYKPASDEESASQFKIFKYDQERWRPVYEGNIVPNEEKRCMLLVYDPYGNPKYPKFSVQIVYF